MTVADIFTKGMAESAEKKAEKEQALVAAQPAQARAAASAASQEQQAAPPQGTMKITAVLEQPEIVLIADVTKEDTNALFLKVRIQNILLTFHLRNAVLFLSNIFQNIHHCNQTLFLYSCIEFKFNFDRQSIMKVVAYCIEIICDVI